MTEDISPELITEFQGFLTLLKSGKGWHAKLAQYATNLEQHELDYLVKLCEDNSTPIETTLKTLA